MTATTGPAGSWPTGPVGPSGPVTTPAGATTGDTGPAPTGIQGPTTGATDAAGSDSWTASWGAFARALGVSFPDAVNRAETILRGLPGGGGYRG